jgi:hypothetical protein
MRGLKRHRSARILAAGHAFVQNVRRGHYDIATDTSGRHRLRAPSTDPRTNHLTSGHPDHAPAYAKMAQRNNALSDSSTGVAAGRLLCSWVPSRT